MSTYTQLEYIESTGGQYIDSGFVITNQNFNLLRIEIDAVLDVDGENTQWELNGTAGGSPYCGLGISNTGLLSYGAGDRIRTTSVSIATKKTERHLYVMDYKNKALYIDGEKIANCSITDLTSKSFSKNFYLFASNSSNEAIYNKQIRKYSIKIYVNDELARNYIPVLRDVDGKVGMYDLVEKKFYVNFGTGSFIAGNKTNWNL